jgi:hypothetical protein
MPPSNGLSFQGLARDDVVQQKSIFKSEQIWNGG